MANIKINFNEIKAKMKPEHGIGQPPAQGLDLSLFKTLKDAGIPFSRLHDMGFDFGGHIIDIHCVFPNFDANAYDPSSYDFTFSDIIITGLVEAGVEPYWRLGVTIENYAHIKAYNIFPPKDNAQWARICEGIIRHYTEGWANGFYYNMTHWEIWNEPDNTNGEPVNPCWGGTMEQFFELYGVASKHLKKCFPSFKIGGYGSCGFYNITGSDGSFGMCSDQTHYFIEFMDKFLAYVKENECPLDFFSWHSYDNEIENTRIYARYAREKLDKAGFTYTETTCNEWNCRCNLRGSAKHAALTAAQMLMFQDEPLDSAAFYDARVGRSVYGGMYNPLTKEPLLAYFAFTAFNRLYELENETVLSKDDDRIYAVSAAKDGRGVLVVSNPTDDDIPLVIDAPGAKAVECYFTNENGGDIKGDIPTAVKKDTVLTLVYSI